MAGAAGGGRVVEAATPSAWPHDGLVLTFKTPGERLRRGDTLVVRSPEGDDLDIIFATVRPDGNPSVWYAINPTLRHWLGWLEPVDERTWVLRMEPFHLALLDDARGAGGEATGSGH